MPPEPNHHTKPPIIVTQTDHRSLSRLAEAYAERSPPVSEELLTELDRAEVVRDELIAPDIVRMGSTVRFTSDIGEDRTVKLVYPGEADIAAGRISVLTPIGAALIGLAAGQCIDWLARDGGLHRLQVEQVVKPEAAPAA